MLAIVRKGLKILLLNFRVNISLHQIIFIFNK